MLVANLGGIDATLQLMQSNDKAPICGCPKDPPVFYKKVRWALYQFLVYRPVVQVLLAVCIYAGQSQIGIIFSVISLVQFLYGFLSLLSFCKRPALLPSKAITLSNLSNACTRALIADENLAEANSNVYGGTKFILLKMAVGLIIGQGVVEEVLFATHALEVDGNDEYTAGEREQRYLGGILLLWCCFYVIAYNLRCV